MKLLIGIQKIVSYYLLIFDNRTWYKRSMTEKIIHIGCPKAGSSFLQNYFTESPEINYDFNLLREFSYSGKLDIESNDFENTGRFNVISSEHLSVPAFGFFNNGVKYKKFDVNLYREQTARHLCQIFPDAKILMVVRGIASLLPSIYSQYVVIGGTLNYSKFLKVYKDVLTELYDYDYIFDVYSRHFGESNVLVLPYELLKKDYEEFLSIIETTYGLPHHPFENSYINKTIASKYVPFILFLSKIVHGLIRILPKSKQLKVSFGYAKCLVSFKEKMLRNNTNQKFKDKGEQKEIEKILKSKATIISNQKYVLPFFNLYQ